MTTFGILSSFLFFHMPHGQKEETKKCHGIICNKCGKRLNTWSYMYCDKTRLLKTVKKGHHLKLRSVLLRASCFCSTVPSVIYYGAPVPVQTFLMIDWSLAYWIDIFLKQCLSWRVPERHCVHDFKTTIPPPTPLPPSSYCINICHEGEIGPFVSIDSLFLC
jgi:hypothetical protein